MSERTCPHCKREVSPAATRCTGCGHPLEPVERAGTRRSSKKAFWLLAVGGCGLAVVFFGGIFAAILIPNFLDSLQKAKQKRTMSDLQAWSRAIEDYGAEHDGAVPRAEDLGELAEVLGPARTGDLASADAWGTPFRYTCWSEELEVDGCDTYRLSSAGRDAVFEHEDPAAYEPGTFDRLDYDADLVLGDGYFHRYPGASS